jgi:hypothetical protein
MRCQRCGADNPNPANECPSCGTRPGSSRRRDGSSYPDAWTGDTPDQAAFRCAAWGILPLAGLVLGPLSLLRVLAAWRRQPSELSEHAPRLLVVTFVLGLIVSACNWAGVVLMVHGLLASGS